MTADDIQIGVVLKPEECDCEFTAEGHTDVTYPEHAIFRHTHDCGALSCRWKSTTHLWFFGDERIPGNIRGPVAGYWPDEDDDE